MPGVGVEPTRELPQRFLRPPRLPFRHPGYKKVYCCNIWKEVKQLLKGAQGEI